MNLQSFILSLFFFILPNILYSQHPCKLSGEKPYNGYCYKNTGISQSWINGRLTCELWYQSSTITSSLCSILTIQEHDWIFSNIRNSAVYLWLGGLRPTNNPSGTPYWIDGSTYVDIGKMDCPNICTDDANDPDCNALYMQNTNMWGHYPCGGGTTSCCKFRIPVCNSILGNDDVNVCNGRGYCRDDNQCTSCDSGYGGNDCEYYYCYGKMEIEGDVCNGGNCIGVDTCECTPPKYGSQCQESIQSLSINVLPTATEIKIPYVIEQLLITNPFTCSDQFQSVLKFGDSPICGWEMDIDGVNTKYLTIQLGSGATLFEAIDNQIDWELITKNEIISFNLQITAAVDDDDVDDDDDDDNNNNKVFMYVGIGIGGLLGLLCVIIVLVIAMCVIVKISRKRKVKKEGFKELEDVGLDLTVKPGVPQRKPQFNNLPKSKPKRKVFNIQNQNKDTVRRVKKAPQIPRPPNRVNYPKFRDDYAIKQNNPSKFNRLDRRNMSLPGYRVSDKEWEREQKELKKEEKKKKKEEEKRRKEEEKRRKKEEKRIKKEQEKNRKEEDNLKKEELQLKKEELQLKKDEEKIKKLEDDIGKPKKKIFGFKSVDEFDDEDGIPLPMTKHIKIEFQHIPLNKISGPITETKNGFSGSYKGKEVFVTKYKKQMSQQIYNKFSIELGRFSKIKHENLINYIGFFENPLKTYTSNVGSVSEPHDGVTLKDYLLSKGKLLKMDDKLKIILGCANGLRELHNNNYVHENLCADTIFIQSRRTLVDEEIIAKIGFGPNKCYKEGYENDAFSSPELVKKRLEDKKKKADFLNDRKNTREDHKAKLKQFREMKKDNEDIKKSVGTSDLYSFGIVMHCTLSQDFSYTKVKRIGLNAMNNPSVRPKLKNPKYYPNYYVNLMTSCFSEDPSKRPTLDRIIETFESVMEN